MKKIYLAGPIMGCNEKQRSGWRRAVIERYKGDYEFIDPTVDLDWSKPSHAIVKKDLQSIKSADAVLANMWKESIGTTLGIAHARASGKIVVVVDPNHYDSKILAFYADEVVSSVEHGIKALKNIFHSTEKLQKVIKRKSGEDKFRRDKIMESLRRACQKAGKDDILVPIKIMPRVIECLCEDSGHEKKIIGGVITTKAVENAIHYAIKRTLLEEPDLHNELEGIIEAWESFVEKKRTPIAGIASKKGEGSISDLPLIVPCTSNEHGTIWGNRITKVRDIPGTERKVFETITKVHGVAGIRFGQFHGNGPAQKFISITMSKPDNPLNVIEAVLRCPANPKGHTQTFQLIVHDVSARDAIYDALKRMLSDSGWLKEAVKPRG